MNETLKSIKNRRSIRVYKSEQIQDTELNAIIEAGLYAPSAMNGQPWHITVVQNPELLKSLNSDAKISMAKSDNAYFSKFGANDAFNIFYHAPTAVIISAATDSPYAATDCAALTQNMLLAAESLNIGSCWVGLANFALKGEKEQAYKESLMIPAGFNPCYTLTLGYKKTASTAAPERKSNSVNFVK